MDEIFVKYLGDGGAYVEGIPARDLTREEWSSIRANLQKLALATRLYQIAGERNGAATPDVITMDLRDGVNDVEATTAARALNARRQEKGA